MRAFFIALATIAIGLSFQGKASAATCTLSLYKTYIPRGEGRAICDDQNLPAEFAGNLTTLAAGLKSAGYEPKRYDQCALGAANDKNDYALVSQLGDCVQAGVQMSCKLYVAIIRNSDNKTVFENTIRGVGIGGSTLHLSLALNGAPSCSEL